MFLDMEVDFSSAFLAWYIVFINRINCEFSSCVGVCVFRLLLVGLWLFVGVLGGGFICCVFVFLILVCVILGALLLTRVLNSP